MAQRPVGRHTGAADGRPTAQPSSDRRLARGQRNRTSIVDATVELINAGNRRLDVKRIVLLNDVDRQQAWVRLGRTDAVGRAQHSVEHLVKGAELRERVYIYSGFKHILLRFRASGHICDSYINILREPSRLKFPNLTH